MKGWGRTLRVGLVVGVIFFGWYMRDIYVRNWRFHLFSWRDWQYVWHQFKAGWVIETAYEWAWLLMLVLMMVVFGLLWWGAVKISWRKSLMTIWRKIKAFFIRPDAKKIVRKKIKVRAKSSHKKVRPAPMMVGGGRPAVKQTGRTMDAAKMQTTNAVPVGGANPPPRPEFTTPAAAFQAPEEAAVMSEEEFNNTPLEDVRLPERMRLEEDLVAILSAANYQVVQDVVLGQLQTAYIGISSDKVVVCVTDVQKGDWLADEEFFNGEEPLWFSESSHRTSPIYTLLTAVQGFAKKMADNGLTQVVVPILIEKEGTIINAADMAEVWKKMGVLVCRTDLGGPEELASFGAVLPKAEDKGTAETVDRVRNLF